MKILVAILVILTALGIPTLALIGEYQCKRRCLDCLKIFRQYKKLHNEYQNATEQGRKER